MPLPLLWLGAVAASLFAVKELADDRKEQQRKRRYSRDAESYSELKRHESPIATYPTDLLSTEEKVKPEIGSLVCCGIGGLLEHTGIWVGDNTIVKRCTEMVLLNLFQYSVLPKSDQVKIFLSHVIQKLNL